MLNFVVGLFCGSVVGIIMMAMLQINRHEE